MPYNIFVMNVEKGRYISTNLALYLLVPTIYLHTGNAIPMYNSKSNEVNRTTAFLIKYSIIAPSHSLFLVSKIIISSRLAAD